MVKLRLQRAGRRNRPFYRIVAADSRAPRDGKFIELIGHYNPINTVTDDYSVDADKAIKWLNDGAQASFTVKSLLKRSGVFFRMELAEKGFSQPDIEAELEKWKAEAKTTPERVKKTKSVRKKTEAKDQPPAAETSAKEEPKKETEKVEAKTKEKVEAKAEEKVEAKVEEKGEAKAKEKGEAKAEEKVEAKAEEKVEAKAAAQPDTEAKSDESGEKTEEKKSE